MADNINIRFIMENATDTAVITDGNSNILSSLPQSNLTKSQRSKVVRTSNVSDLILNLNWGGSGKNISGIALIRHNLSSTATWRIQLYDAQNQTGNVLYDSGVISAIPVKSLGDLDWGVDPLGATVFDGWDENNTFSTKWFTQVTALSVRITVADPSNTDGYIQASRLFIGVASTPTINVKYGLQSSWEEDTQQFRSEGGSLRSDSKPQFRSFVLTMDDLNNGERSAFFDNVRVVGKSLDFLVSVFPEFDGTTERDYTMQCKLSSMPRFTNISHDRHSVTFNLVEA
jgi:hypothetical protein